MNLSLFRKSCGFQILGGHAQGVEVSRIEPQHGQGNRKLVSLCVAKLRPTRKHLAGQIFGLKQFVWKQVDHIQKSTPGPARRKQINQKQACIHMAGRCGQCLKDRNLRLLIILGFLPGSGHGHPMLSRGLTGRATSKPAKHLSKIFVTPQLPIECLKALG